MLRTNYSYDARNLRVTQVVGYGTPLQRTSTMVYDANGNIIQSIDTLGYLTTYGYDILNRRISVQNPDGGTATTSYDANGNVLSETDPLGHSTTYVHDVLNRKTQSTDARGGGGVNAARRGRKRPCAAETPRRPRRTGTLDGRAGRRANRRRFHPARTAPAARKGRRRPARSPRAVDPGDRGAHALNQLLLFLQPREELY